MLFFLWAPGIMFFPHCPFLYNCSTLQASPSSFYVFFTGSTTSRPAVVRKMNLPPPRKNSSQGKTRPDRGSDENQAYFLLYTSFLYPQGAPGH